MKKKNNKKNDTMKRTMEIDRETTLANLRKIQAQEVHLGILIPTPLCQLFVPKF